MRVLILLRHAHRDTSVRSSDNGLSEKGRAQAAALARYYLNAFPPELAQAAPRILSSPKRRCRETVEGLARELGVEVEPDDRLLELGSRERAADLRKRVASFIDEWKHSGRPLTVACSHGDWLPLAVEGATGARVEMKKSAWAEIHLDERGRPRLHWLIQGFTEAAACHLR